MAHPLHALKQEIDDAARALSAWNGEDIGAIERAIASIEDIAERVAARTRESTLSARDRVELFGEITAIAAGVLAKLVSMHQRTGDATIRELGRRLQRSTALLSKFSGQS